MRRASCLLRSGPDYRREAFLQGLNAAGFRASINQLSDPGPGDVLVVWNRYGFYDALATRYAAAGATILVAENGWIGQDAEGRKVYALARTHHNGAGEWTVGASGRWASFGVDLQPWRTDGDHILVLPQRGIGPRGVAMPFGWARDVLDRLKRVTDRKVIVRPHPGKDKSDPDFSSCWAAVTWGSGAGIKAIAAGIPVFHELPNWIGAPAAKFGISEIEQPFLGDRLPMLERLAWAQWTLDEIERGVPFRSLCSE